MININMNEVAKDITLEEGKMKSLSIAQIKEVLKILFESYELEELVAMYYRYND